MQNETDTTVDHYDFLAAALVPTNEQRIVSALETIVELLQAKQAPVVTGPDPKAEANRAEQIAKLAAKTMGNRKK